jgi:uncharacterized LabA/DUF88 family protein
MVIKAKINIMLHQQQNIFWFKAVKFSAIFYSSLAIAAIGIVIKNLALATCPLIFALFLLYLEKNNTRTQQEQVTTPAVTLPITPTRDRVGIFIDGQYLYHAAKSDRMTISYPKLKRVLQKNTPPETEVFFYGNLANPNPNYDKFLETLQSMGYQVVCNSDFSSLITSKMNDLDTVVIVSGNRDRDLEKTFKEALDRGIRVKLVAFPSSTDVFLWELASEYINILSLPQVCQPSLPILVTVATRNNNHSDPQS